MKNDDKYLRHIDDIKPIPGMTVFDSAMKKPGASCVRTFEVTEDSKQQDFQKDKEEILAKGCACGLDTAGICRHFEPGLRFLGFLEGQTEDRAGVKVRGAIVLTIEGTSAESRGLPVFTSGPDQFSLKESRGAAEIGKIKYWQNGRVSVAFRRDGDPKPLNLSLNRI